MTERLDVHGFNVEARPLCPFCSKPFGDDMIDDWVESAEYESGSETSAVEIVCDGCKRLIYRKG